MGVRRVRDLLEFILNHCEGQGYALGELTLFGIRDSSDIEKDVINDYLGFFTAKDIFVCRGTTDSGVRGVTDKSLRVAQGTFHLYEGFHKNIWSVGKHRGYEALVNDWRYCLPTSGWRDANFNFVHDAADLDVRGYFGINFHRMNLGAAPRLIGYHSIGCQVVQASKDFSYIMETVKATEHYKSLGARAAFNYLLFQKEILPQHLCSVLEGL